MMLDAELVEWWERAQRSHARSAIVSLALASRRAAFLWLPG